MTYKSHITLGITFYLLLVVLSKPFIQNMSFFLLIDFFLITVVTSLVPDMDTDKSFLTRRIGPILISVILLYVIVKTGYLIFLLLIIWFLLAKFTKHRTFTHSILGLLLFSTPFFNTIYIVPVFIGYSSHLFADMLTRQGVKLFYPISHFHFKLLNMTTGERGERIFSLLIKILNIILVIYALYLYLL